MGYNFHFNRTEDCGCLRIRKMETERSPAANQEQDDDGWKGGHQNQECRQILSESPATVMDTDTMSSQISQTGTG